MSWSSRHVAVDRHGEHVVAGLQHLDQGLDVRDVAVVAEHLARVRGVRADQRDRRDRRGQRKDAVVAQQHHALGCKLPGELDLFRGPRVRCNLVDIDVRALEQTEPQLRLQHPPHR